MRLSADATKTKTVAVVDRLGPRPKSNCSMISPMVKIQVAHDYIVEVHSRSTKPCLKMTRASKNHVIHLH